MLTPRSKSLSKSSGAMRLKTLATQSSSRSSPTMSQNLSLNLSRPPSSPTCKMPTVACSKVALKRSSLFLNSSSVRFCSVMSYWTPSQYSGSPPSVPDELRLIAHPHHASVAGDQAILYLVRFAGLVGPDLFGEHPLPVFGMQCLEPVLFVDDLGVCGVAEHGLVL